MINFKDRVDEQIKWRNKQVQSSLLVEVSNVRYGSVERNSVHEPLVRRTMLTFYPIGRLV